MQKLNDVDIAVDIVKETKALFPRFSCCSFDKGFHSPDNQRQLAEELEHCTMPKKPNKPTELTEHDGICFAFYSVNKLAPWAFIEGKSSPYRVSPKPRMIVNDMVSMINFAKSGLVWRMFIKSLLSLILHQVNS
jgi:hypothetical protein